MSTLSFKNVNKIYANKVQAVYDFNLEVQDKEFIVFVGPSGCGKSTTLRMIAGLEDISSGEIYIDGTLINNVAPKDRNIAMVFQNYALYPHMTVFDNMAFALKLRKAMFPVYDKDGNRALTYDHAKVDEMYKELLALEEQKPMDKAAVEAKREEIEKFKETKTEPAYELRHYSKAELAEKVNAAAEILGLEPYLKRKPAALSGGQRQRVALGRAIVRNPKVFLMDEPLSNLDAKLRVQMRSEISKIHQTVGATTIYVTHDQTEAMTMATRIVCMKDGYIQQIGTPKELFNTPANMFVAGFIGSPAMNFIRGVFDGNNFNATSDDGTCISIELPNDKKELLSDYVNKELILGVRPEDIYVSGDINNKHPYGKPIDLKCDISELLGRELVIYSLLGSQRIIVKTTNQDDVEQGTTRPYSFDMDAVHFFDPETTMRIVK